LAKQKRRFIVIAATDAAAQGCQMVSFQTKNPYLGKFLGAWIGKCGYILWPFGIFYGDLGYFMTILYSFGTFFPVLVTCTKKNLATLLLLQPRSGQLD
jgi:hypothetical protein